jgi:hypothetical protein
MTYIQPTGSTPPLPAIIPYGDLWWAFVRTARLLPSTFVAAIGGTIT